MNANVIISERVSAVFKWYDDGTRLSFYFEARYTEGVKPAEDQRAMLDAIERALHTSPDFYEVTREATTGVGYREDDT